MFRETTLCNYLCEFVEDKLKPKNIKDFKVNDIVEDSLVLEKSFIRVRRKYI